MRGEEERERGKATRGKKIRNEDGYTRRQPQSLAGRPFLYFFDNFYRLLLLPPPLLPSYSLFPSFSIVYSKQQPTGSGPL